MSQQLSSEAVDYAAKQTGLTTTKARAALKLMVENEATIPFISRYRKEQTGGLDEVQIQNLGEAYEAYTEREKRRQFILDTLKKNEQLTDDLKKKIETATTLNQLEDLYAPYKSKKKTKGAKAKEAGLAPLAEKLVQGIPAGELQSTLESYLNKEKAFDTAEKVMQGAQDYLAEQISHTPEIKEKLRELYWNEALLASSKKPKAEEVKQHQKYRDYFEFSQPLKQLTHAKNVHRYLAVRRGMNQKVLKVDVSFDADKALQTMTQTFFSGELNGDHPQKDWLEETAKKAYQNSLHPSLDLEMKGELKKKADEAAINVFGVNLKNLLLQPYLGAKSVMGIDPGVKTGCKVAIVDQTGEFQLDTVIYPHKPQKEIEKSAKIIEALIDKYDITYIAVGNGTYGRETLGLLKKNVPQIKEKKSEATLVNEDGASIYSASELAREEFPDKDTTVRGAISIARRFQDPLAELVKIEPKNLGVGQYQHDVNQSRLKKSLGQIVENCVNHVGVDLNTASAPLLSHISGIGPALAKNIVQKRQESGGFKKREELLNVSRFSSKAFEQAAGFLRIYGGEHPLDATFIHPERYELLSQWAEKKEKSLKDLIEDETLIQELENDNELKEQIGAYTHEDIVQALKVPGQDPRTEFQGAGFRDDVTNIDDLKVGTWYPGVITNITQFGAFVDMGIKENGLLHISQMANRFVDDPLNVFKLGDQIKVRVIEVDKERGRISLSAKEEQNEKNASTAKKSTKKKANKSKRSEKKKAPDKSKQQGKKKQKGELTNNPFAALKDFKIDS